MSLNELLDGCTFETLVAETADTVAGDNVNGREPPAWVVEGDTIGRKWLESYEKEIREEEEEESNNESSGIVSSALPDFLLNIKDCRQQYRYPRQSSTESADHSPHDSRSSRQRSKESSVTGGGVVSPSHDDGYHSNATTSVVSPDGGIGQKTVATGVMTMSSMSC